MVAILIFVFFFLYFLFLFFWQSLNYWCAAVCTFEDRPEAFLCKSADLLSAQVGGYYWVNLAFCGHVISVGIYHSAGNLIGLSIPQVIAKSIYFYKMITQSTVLKPFNPFLHYSPLKDSSWHAVFIVLMFMLEQCKFSLL